VLCKLLTCWLRLLPRSNPGCEQSFVGGALPLVSRSGADSFPSLCPWDLGWLPCLQASPAAGEPPATAAAAGAAEEPAAKRQKPEGVATQAQASAALQEASAPATGATSAAPGLPAGAPGAKPGPGTPEAYPGPAYGSLRPLGEAGGLGSGGGGVRVRGRGDGAQAQGQVAPIRAASSWTTGHLSFGSIPPSLLPSLRLVDL